MRTLPKLFAALALVVAGSGATDALAQSSIPTADAQAFVGTWAVNIEAQGQQFTMNVAIKDAAGSLAADVTAEQMGSQAVKTISKNGESLVLAYEAEAQGQVFPIKITMAPDGATQIDFADGMFTASGTGTKQ